MDVMMPTVRVSGKGASMFGDNDADDTLLLSFEIRLSSSPEEYNKVLEANGCGVCDNGGEQLIFSAGRRRR